MVQFCVFCLCEGGFFPHACCLCDLALDAKGIKIDTLLFLKVKSFWDEKNPWGAPDTLENRILKAFCGERLDGLVYGHSHCPVCHWKDSVLLFNPANRANRRWAPYHSVGILNLTERIEGCIMRIDKLKKIFLKFNVQDCLF
jgi:hypothetical protein